MKKELFLLLCLTPVFLSAQQALGKITFTETVQMHIDIPDGPDKEAMMKMMPTSQSFDNALYFNDKASLYRDADNQANDQEINHDNDGMQMKIVMKRPDNRVYRDLENGKLIESREFFGRDFLINEEPDRQLWKLTGEQKQIQGFTCQKAMLQDTSRKVYAWFTPQIPVSVGPGHFADLPGMILEVDINNGDHKVTASKVELGKLDDKALEKPSKGKKVTRAEFDKIVAEKNKEMEEQMGGSGGSGMRVIIRN